MEIKKLKWRAYTVMAYWTQCPETLCGCMATRDIASAVVDIISPQCAFVHWNKAVGTEEERNRVFPKEHLAIEPWKDEGSHWTNQYGSSFAVREMVACSLLRGYEILSWHSSGSGDAMICIYKAD